MTGVRVDRKTRTVRFSVLTEFSGVFLSDWVNGALGGQSGHVVDAVLWFFTVRHTSADIETGSKVDDGADERPVGG